MLACVSCTSGPERRAQSQRALLSHLAAIAVYTAASLIFLNPSPLLGFTRHPYEDPSGDPQVFVWGLAWYSHAIAHGLDLIFTKAVFSPVGYNLAWSTTILGPSLLVYPVTRYFGPIVSYNLLFQLAPVLSAYAAFALCYHVTRSALPALAGGFIYGFSSHAQFESANLHLALSFILPLITLLFLLRVENRIGRFEFASLLAICLIFQMLSSPEIFASASMFGVLALAIGWRMAGERWRLRARTTIRDTIWIVALVVAVLSPYFRHFVPSPFGLLPIYNPAHCSIDLLNFLVPTETSIVGNSCPARALHANFNAGTEPVGYLGLLSFLALVAVISPSSKPERATAVERILTILLLVICVMALGPVIRLNGAAIAPGPWLLAVPMPILNNALPARFMLYAFLLLAVLASIWFADRRWQPSTRWAVAVFTLLSILPSLGSSREYELNAFFSQGLYRRYLTEGDTVLILPYGSNGPGMLWQAESDFYFKMAGGYLGSVPAEYSAWPIVPALIADAPNILGYADQFKAFLSAHDVRAVIVSQAQYPRYANLGAALGVKPEKIGGVTLFKLNPSTLNAFRDITAAEMDSRYNVGRFGLVISAARAYLESGNKLDDLSPVTLRKLGFLSADLAGDTPHAQTGGYPLISATRGSREFQAAIAFIMSHALVRRRLAVELGPLAPNDSSSGIWIGPAPEQSIAVGVVAGASAAVALRSRFGGSATAVYYPYPLPFAEHLPTTDEPQQFLMVFRRDRFVALARGLPPSRFGTAVQRQALCVSEFGASLNQSSGSASSPR